MVRFFSAATFRRDFPPKISATDFFRQKFPPTKSFFLMQSQFSFDLPKTQSVSFPAWPPPVVEVPTEYSTNYADLNEIIFQKHYATEDDDDPEFDRMFRGQTKSLFLREITANGDYTADVGGDDLLLCGHLAKDLRTPVLYDSMWFRTLKDIMAKLLRLLRDQNKPEDVIATVSRQYAAFSAWAKVNTGHYENLREKIRTDFAGVPYLDSVVTKLDTQWVFIVKVRNLSLIHI